MDKPILKDREVFPSPEVLKDTLGESFTAYNQLADLLANKYEIFLQWNYYTDGYAWLCKLLHKKKNLGWLVPYDNYFVVNCNFAERFLEKIEALDIDEQIKETYYQNKTKWKIAPMSATIRTEELPDDVIKMVLFKKGLK